MKKLYGIIAVALLVIASVFMMRMHAHNKAKHAPYLTIYGPVLMMDGIGRQSADLIQTLKHFIKIDFVATQDVSYSDVAPDILPYLKKTKNFKSQSKVALLEDVVWLPDTPSYKKFVSTTTEDQVRIAYSMFESTAIPDEWVVIFNKYFDAIAVPDAFLVDVYKKCGVKPPIFVLPLGLHLKKFTSEPQREKAHSPMVFGNLGACRDRKNQLTLVRAFAKAFGDSKDVLLKINCRNGDEDLIRTIKEEIETLGLHNVQFTTLGLNSDSYFKLYQSLDCLVSISKSEGFSIQPREAMALGIPVIVTDNTAQSVICQSGFVRVVPSLKLESASYFWGLNYGDWFCCSVDDVTESLLDVYNNYSTYLEKAQAGREWVQQYEYKNLRHKYLSLLKPKNMILGNEDKVTDEYMMTTSEALYNKFQNILGK